MTRPCDWLYGCLYDYPPPCCPGYRSSTPYAEEMMSMHMLWPRDAKSVEGARIERAAAARVWRFARPYRRQVIGFLSAVIVQAVLGLVPPLLFGSIIDRAIPNEDRRLLVIFAGCHCGRCALPGEWLVWANAYWSSRIGEGVIYDLRVALVRPRAATTAGLLHSHTNRHAHKPAQQ